MEVVSINLDSGKLKFWSVEMPNAPYSNRYKGFIKSITSLLRLIPGYYISN